MSKLFFDHLVVFEEIEGKIKKTASSKEEREELWGLVDEVTTHKVLEKILDRLPRAHHEEFLELFHKCPHDEIVIFGYLRDKAGKSIEDDLKQDLKNLEADLLKLFQ
jgi:hypothetical protein